MIFRTRISTVVQLWLVSLVALCSTLVTDAELVVQVAFEPPEITLGQRSAYVISVEGSSEEISGALPTVPGLNIARTPGRSTQSHTSIINGRVTSTHTVRYSFETRANSTGEFTVPSWTLSVGDQRVKLPAATLSVLEPGEEMRDLFFLRLDPEINTMYVGEVRSVDVVLLLRQDVEASLRSTPRKSGDAFLDPDTNFEPTVTQVRYKNRVYRAARWPITLTPVRAGAESIEFSVDLAVMLPDRSGSRRRDDPFDSFFGRSLFERRQVEERTVTSGSIPIQVIPPPIDGRPESFNGAIGTFSVQHKLSAEKLRALEPVTLTVTISGIGNLDRIEPPQLAPSDHWRVYPPRTEFIPRDDRQDAGTLSIEYVLVPDSAEATTTPAIPFSYFNPESKTYETADIPSYTVQVEGSSSDSAMHRPRDQSDDAEETQIGHRLQLSPGRWVVPPRPVPFYLSPRFVVVQVVIIILLAGFTLWRRQINRVREDPHYVRRISGSRAVRNATDAARNAVRSGNAVAFFKSARLAIQCSLIRHIPIHQRPESLTWHDIETYLRAHAIPQENHNVVREIFDTADALTFGNTSLDPGNLHAWEQKLIVTLRILERQRS